VLRENCMKTAIRLSDRFTCKKLLRFVLPSIVMMVFTSIYGVVDGLFVSNFAGKTPFAAINLVMPFIMVLGGLGFMIGTGGTALVGKLLGQGEPEEANRCFSMMIWFALLLGGVLTVVGIVFMKPVSLFLGATEEMLGDCLIYGRIVIAFTVPFMLQNIFQSFLIAAEKPKLGLVATVAAGVTNMTLDFLFVGVLPWGVAGAAIATGISQCVGAAIPLFYFLRKDSLLRLIPTRLRAKPILAACGNGSSELMSSISSSIVGMLYNFRLLKYIGEDGVSAYGVLMYVQFVFVAIFIGYAIGCAPIISFHYGAGNRDELKNLLKISVRLMAGGGVVLTALALLLARPLAAVFVGYDAALFDLTCHAFEVFSFAFLFAGFNIFASSFFTALNNGGVSAAISFLRTLVFQSASVILLPLLFDVDGIWYAITAAEVFATLISAMFLFLKQKKYGYM
jgi:putative MATE family efflux protein